MKRTIALLLLCLASPLSAQGTAADSVHWRATKADLDSLKRDASAPGYSKRAQLRIRVRDSLRTVVVAPIPTPTPTPTPTPAPDTTVVVTPTPTPTPDSTIVATGSIGPALRAELPRAVPNTAYPVGLPQTRLAAGANLQAALNGCTGELLLPAGSTWLVNLDLAPARTSWCVIRTDLADSVLGTPGTRMTPGKAARLRLAKILSPSTSNVPAVTGGLNVAFYRFTGVEIGTTAAVTSLNTIVKFGVTDGWVQTLANAPHDLIIDRSYVHGSPTLSLSRCVALNTGTAAIVDSWVSECHGSNGDSQAIANWNGPGPQLIQNNHLEAGHEVIAFGGGTFTVTNGRPCDITIRGNHITRPQSWKGVWQVKNLMESKNVCRLLVEGNVFENNWADAQDGFAILLKSENQNNDNPWTQTSDVTIRYNRFTCTGNGINFAGQYSNQDTRPSVVSARITAYDNTFDKVNVAPCTSEGTAIQLLNGITDAAIFHTSIANLVSGKFLSMDGNVAVRAALHSLALYSGQFGISTSRGSGASGWTASAPGALWATNDVVGCSTASMPPSTICPTSWPTTFATGYDARPIGADTARVNAATKGAVVLDLVAGRPRSIRVATPRQAGYRATPHALRAGAITGKPTVEQMQAGRR